MARDGIALVLVVRGVSCLSRLSCLRRLRCIVNQHLLIAVAAAASAVQGRSYREAVRQLHVAVAPQCRQQSRMSAIEVRIIHGAHQQTGHVALAFARHSHLIRELRANEEKLVREPGVSRKAGFALRPIFGIPTMGQWLTLSVGPSG